MRMIAYNITQLRNQTDKECEWSQINDIKVLIFILLGLVNLFGEEFCGDVTKTSLVCDTWL